MSQMEQAKEWLTTKVLKLITKLPGKPHLLWLKQQLQEYGKDTKVINYRILHLFSLYCTNNL